MTGKRKAGRPSTIDSRRTEILEKAAECFSQNGYNKTTLDDIANALGFNKAALYYYFKDKEDIFKTVLKSSILKLWDDVKTETLAVDGFEERLMKYFDVKMNAWLMLLNINGISRENMINLNLSFAESILHYRQNEIDFLKDILLAENPNYNEADIKDFINLLIDTQTDITMSGILLNDISKDLKIVNGIKLVKQELLRHFIISFRTGFVP